MNDGSLAIEAYNELLQSGEIAAAGNNRNVTEMPSLDDVLTELGQLPPEALFLGMAEDSLPVMLNLHDSVPGPLLVSGRRGTGKTNLLQTIAAGIEKTKNPVDVQFGVITPEPAQFAQFRKSESCADILPIYENAAMDFVLSLNAWAHANKSKQAVVLLLDGLDKVKNWNDNSLDDLRWLLMRGPARRVWPIVTLNPEKNNEVKPLMEHFRTKIYGAGAIDAENPNGPGELIPGVQFAMKEGLKWLRFWVPQI